MPDPARGPGINHPTEHRDHVDTPATSEEEAADRGTAARVDGEPWH